MKKIIIFANILILSVLTIHAQVKVENFDLTRAPYNINGNAMDFDLDSSGDPVFLISPVAYNISINYNTGNRFYLNKKINNQRENLLIKAPVSEYLYFFPYGKIHISETDDVFLYPISTKDDKEVWSDYTVIKKDLTNIFYSRYGGSKLESLKERNPEVIFRDQKNFVRYRSSSPFGSGLFGQSVNYGNFGGSGNFVKLLEGRQEYVQMSKVRFEDNELPDPLCTALDKNNNVWTLTKGAGSAYFIVAKQSNNGGLSTAKGLDIESDSYYYMFPFYLIPRDDNSCIVVAGKQNHVFLFNGTTGDLKKLNTSSSMSTRALLKPIIDSKNRLWVLNNDSMKLTGIDTNQASKNIEYDLSKFTTYKVTNFRYDDKKRIFWLMCGNNLYKLYV